ncbi:MAG: cell division protein ZapA, partial [Agathobacter sp.]|nr:cell division protein ZapA [Agathobacter sp.]
ARAQVEKLERDVELRDKEIYDLKHDLISNQLKTESADDRIKELEAENRELLLNKARLEATLEDALLEGIGSKK